MRLAGASQSPREQRGLGWGKPLAALALPAAVRRTARRRASGCGGRIGRTHRKSGIQSQNIRQAGVRWDRLGERAP